MKAQRQKKILEIISKQPIETQQQLAAELQSAGFNVTQATVSRDIKELGLIKVTGNNGTVYYTAPERTFYPKNDERLKRFFKDSVISIDFSENLIIVKTYPGEAQGVASALDHANWKEIIGTVGGDDTILIIVKPKEATPIVMKRLAALSGR